MRVLFFLKKVFYNLLKSFWPLKHILKKYTNCRLEAIRKTKHWCSTAVELGKIKLLGLLFSCSVEDPIAFLVDLISHLFLFPFVLFYFILFLLHLYKIMVSYHVKKCWHQETNLEKVFSNFFSTLSLEMSIPC